MSYIYYIRTNEKLMTSQRRIPSRDDIMPENTMIHLEAFEDSKSQYHYNYILGVDEFSYFKSRQDHRMANQIIDLINQNKSVTVLEVKWLGKINGQPREGRKDIRYHKLTEQLILDIMTNNTIDAYTLTIT